jgi:hypothetical protein
LSVADSALATGDPTPNSVDLVDLAEEEWARRTLLVITAEPRAASASLRLPFTRARVCGVDDLGDVAALAETCFDTVVVDGPALGAERRDVAATWAGEHVGPDGRVVILLEPSAGGAATTDSLTGLTWLGVATLDGRPCAVLRRAGAAPMPEGEVTGDDIAGRLVAVGQTLLAMPPAERPVTPPAPTAPCDDGQRGGEGQSRRDGQSGRDREDSEAALLHHLRRLVRELADERRLRIAAEERYLKLEHRHRTLQAKYSRLRESKLGVATARYWRLRKSLRRRWNA